MADQNSIVVWVFGAMATGAASVAGYLWTEIVHLDRRMDGLEQTAQVKLAELEECKRLADTYINADLIHVEKTKEMFVARGCDKTKLEALTPRS